MTSFHHHTKKIPQDLLGGTSLEDKFALTTVQVYSTIPGLHRGIFIVGHGFSFQKRFVWRALGRPGRSGEGEAGDDGLGDGDLQFVQSDQLRRTLHGGTPRKMGWKLKINFRSFTYQLPFEQKIGLTKYVIYIFNTLSNIFLFLL